MPVKYVLVLSLIKKKYLHLQSVTLHVGLHFFHFNLICNMNTFRRKQEMSQTRDECPQRNWSSIDTFEER